MKRLFAFALLFALGLSGWAQNSTQGREFWFSFMKNGYQENDGNWVYMQVMISARRSCEGTISNPRTSWTRTFTIGDEGITTVQIPESAGYNDGNEGVPSDFGLLLTASDTVSVFIANCATNSFDASFVLPSGSLGSEYLIQCDNQSRTQNQSFFGFGGFPEMETSAFLVVATEDDTEIDIIPAVTTLRGQQAGVPYSITLNRGQTYAMRSNNNTTHRDLTGTSVKAHDGKKIAVFNGNTLTSIPNSCINGHDHIFEQALPVRSWGRQFAITSSRRRTRDKVKVTSLFDNDTVWCNGQQQAVVDAGQSYEFWLYSGSMGSSYISGGSCFVETSQPSMVYLYNASSSDPESQSNEVGDPSMVWIPPIEQRIEEITFCTFHHSQASIDKHYVNIVVESLNVNDVYLDGNLLDADSFEPVIGNDLLSCVKVEINHGVHNLSCSQGLVAYVYGFGEVKGYAYCVGANVEDLNGMLYVDDQLSSVYPDGLILCEGESVDFEIRTNYPVRQVVWDFDGEMVTGGATAVHTYQRAGSFVTKACVEGEDPYTSMSIFDTLTIAVEVGAPEYYYDTLVLCDVSVYNYHGLECAQSGDYEAVYTNFYGCDSTYALSLFLDYTPNYEIIGNHWPIGGSETYISVNEYGIQINEPYTRVDTVIWQIDCPNWYFEPHGNGATGTLYIYTYLLDPVMLHAWAINQCDTVHQEFFIQTSYFDLEENGKDDEFTVSPNPTDGNVMLRLGNLRGEAVFQVFDNHGRMVDEFVVDAGGCKEKDYKMPDVSNGLYYFVAKAEGKALVRKIVYSR